MNGVAVFQASSFKSHMPFCDGETLLFCRSDRSIKVSFEPAGTLAQRLRSRPSLRVTFKSLAPSSEVEYRNWKLAFCSWKERVPHRLETGLPDEAVECSPAFFKSQGQWHVSFIGGVPGRHKIDYRLYKMSGPSLDKLSAAEPFKDLSVKAGFISPSHVCIASGRCMRLVDRATQDEIDIETPFARILRASFTADHPERLIITGSGGQHEVMSLLFHTAERTTLKLESEYGAYKPTIWGDRMLVADRLEGGFEERQVKEVEFRTSTTRLTCQLKYSVTQ